MPPKRRSSSTRETRSGTRSQPPAQASGSAAAVTGESSSANRTRPNKRTARGDATPRRARETRTGPKAQNEELDVYREMLAEVVGPSKSRQQERSDSEGRPSKRRKAVESPISETEPSKNKDKGKGVLREDLGKLSEAPSEDNYNLNNQKEEAPTADEDESDEDESEEEDWEDVDLSKPIINFKEPPKPQTLELVLDQKEKRKAGPVRRVITAVDRRIRLEIHKMHLLCLLLHVYQRSRWCNNSTVKSNLRPLISKEIYSLLNPNPNEQQFRRSYNFLEGLKKLSDMWQKRFQITRRGLKKPRWQDNEMVIDILSYPPKAGGDPPMKLDDFLATSISLAGSRDLGAQLFCALLRSIGVTCRLVCSLQPLPFSFLDKPIPIRLIPTIPNEALEEDTTSNDNTEIKVNNQFGGPGLATQSLVGGRRSALRRPGFREPISKPPTPEKPPARITIRESPYPVYWVEAWNTATQKWIAVDPLVTSTIGKPSKIEPPMADGENSMSYVVAFEEEGQATDVTRRYAKSYNGKTRRSRVSSTKGGQEWWALVLQVFRRGWEMDRDQVEAAELMDREVLEPIPNNIQDLKGHPLFALKRHLKRGEIIHPERKVGSITTGSGNKKVTEPIFRRQDVKVVKTSEQWYRTGRELKAGEQPLKYVTARRRIKGRSDDYLDSEPEEEGGDDSGPRQSAMYAEFQTELYVPPSVVMGRVPKNSFGNLDVFVPSMVPKGAVHLPYKGLVKVAQLLGIDYAEAVTGFDFKNRQASPIMNGIVVAEEYQAAVMAVMETLLDEKNEADEQKKSMETLKRWRRFLIGLRIRERLGIYQDDKTINDVEKGIKAGSGIKRAQGTENIGTSGGFFAEAGDQEKRAKETENMDTSSGSIAEAGTQAFGNNNGGGFIAEDTYQGGGFIADANDNGGGGGFIVDDNNRNQDEGGFIPEEEGNQGGGGFVPEEEESEDEEVLEDPEDEDLGWF